MDSQEFGNTKFPLQTGCLVTSIALLVFPFYFLRGMFEHFTMGIESHEYFTTKKGLATMLIAGSYLITLTASFVLLKKIKTLVSRAFASFFLSLIVFSIELVSAVALGNLILFVTLLIILDLIKLYFTFFRKLNITKVVSFLKTKKNVSSLETFNLKTKKSTLEIKNPYAGIYIQGGAGSGKTESLLKPFIKQGIEQNFAYIIYDFKGDLSLFEKQLLEANNIHDSYTLNFKEPLLSNRFNPINPNFLNSPAEVFELSKTLFYNLSPGSIKQSNNNYFLDEAINLFTAVVLFFKNKHKEYCTIPHIISSLAQVPLNKMIKLVSSDFEALPYIASLKNVSELGANKQLAGVTGTLQGNLAKFSSKELFWILSGNDFTPDINNPDNIKRLTIINNSVLPNFYAPLIATVINVCLKNMNDQGKHKSAVYLDEAPTLYIPEFEQIPATARSNKIATIYATQDYMQIVDKYGREKAQTIISNLASQFFGRTTNVESIKLISELFGKYDKVFQTQSTSKSAEIFDVGDFKRSRSKNESIQERYRVTSDELIDLNPGEFYSITGTTREKSTFKRIPEIKISENTNQIRILSNRATDYDVESNYLAINKTVQRIFN